MFGFKLLRINHYLYKSLEVLVVHKRPQKNDYAFRILFDFRPLGMQTSVQSLENCRQSLLFHLRNVFFENRKDFIKELEASDFTFLFRETAEANLLNDLVAEHVVDHQFHDEHHLLGEPRLAAFFKKKSNQRRDDVRVHLGELGPQKNFVNERKEVVFDAGFGRLKQANESLAESFKNLINVFRSVFVQSSEVVHSLELLNPVLSR